MMNKRRNIICAGGLQPTVNRLHGNRFNGPTRANQFSQTARQIATRIGPDYRIYWCSVLISSPCCKRDGVLTTGTGREELADLYGARRLNSRPTMLTRQGALINTLAQFMAALKPSGIFTARNTSSRAAAANWLSVLYCGGWGLQALSVPAKLVDRFYCGDTFLSISQRRSAATAKHIPGPHRKRGDRGF